MGDNMVSSGRTGLGPIALLLLPFVVMAAWDLRRRLLKSPLFIYSIIYALTVASPYIFGFYGLSYFIVSTILSLYYIYLCYNLLKEENTHQELKISKKIFKFSILHLFAIFIIILMDGIMT